MATYPLWSQSSRTSADCEFSDGEPSAQPSSSIRKSAKPTRVLLALTDGSLASLLSSELTLQGFLVTSLTDVDAAWEEKGPFQLVLLEADLRTTTASKEIQRFRLKYPKLPIMVVASRNTVEDKVHALLSGADDCMGKPLSLAELFARISALLRRETEYVSSSQTIAGLTLNREERKVERNGRRIELTPREFELLDVMVQNAGHPVSRSRLLQLVWNVTNEASTNIVDVYMKYLRDKVDVSGEQKLIHTVRGFGYELRAD